MNVIGRACFSILQQCYNAFANQKLVKARAPAFFPRKIFRSTTRLRFDLNIYVRCDFSLQKVVDIGTATLGD